MRPGIYGARGRRTDWTANGTAAAPITFEGAPDGARPTILGYNKIEGSHLRLSGLSFQGPTGRIHPPTSDNRRGEEVMVWIAGAGDELDRCVVAGSRWHAGVYVAGPGHVQLVANYVYDNGDFGNPAQANLDQGIYWAQGSDGLIADNLIVHNLADGIQLYPAASGVTVEQNTIVGNGKSGVIIADMASHNEVLSNIVADNSANSIRSYALAGAGNLVENNLVWNNGDGNLGAEAAGLMLDGNIRADPRFVASGNYRLRPGSPAIGRALRTPAMLPYDIDGTSRGLRPDIGAYQSK